MNEGGDPEVADQPCRVLLELMQAAREVVLIVLPTTPEKDVRRLSCCSMAPQAVEPAHKAEEGLTRGSHGSSSR